uniref:Uncharacterized protein n=1 Tax=candidate division CPR3 bacterium TaxID=2268181 RepID=A0A7C4M234_UNCC3
MNKSNSDIQNPYIYEGKVPLRTELGGNEYMILFNDIRMIKKVEVGNLNFNVIYIDCKIQITRSYDKEELLIKEYPINQMSKAKKKFKELIKNKGAIPKPPNTKPSFNKPYKKPRFLLEVISGKPLTLIDIRGEQAKVLKRYPPELFEEAKKGLKRLHKEDKKEQKEIKELAKR